MTNPTKNPCKKCDSAALARSAKKAKDNDGETQCNDYVGSPGKGGWFVPQFDANPGKLNEGQFKWTNVNTVMDHGDTGANVSAVELAKQWYINRMSDTELTQRMEKLKWKPEIKDTAKRLKQFRIEISKGKGATITCIKPADLKAKGLTVTVSQPKDGDFDKFKCSDKGKFGPRNIIQEEYEEWSADYLRKPPKPTDIPDWTTFYSTIGSPNSGFEQCMNRVFRDSDAIDHSIISELKATKSILDLKDNHVQYMRRKFEAFLVQTNHKQLMKCMDKLYLDESICKASLVYKMSKILSVIMYIIDYDINVMNIQNESEKKKMMYIIDELGDLIPRVLEHIIKLSEAAENDKCGQTTGTTEILKELHGSVFASKNNVVNFDLGISKMISDATNQEFNRTTALTILGIAFLKYF